MMSKLIIFSVVFLVCFTSTFSHTNANSLSESVSESVSESTRTYTCPAQYATCCAHQGACSPLGLPSPSDYLFRKAWTAVLNTVQKKTDCRAAWQALRGTSTCRALLSSAANIAKITLTPSATADWSTAKRGNVVNGILDCTKFKVHIMPQPARAQNAAQTQWTNQDLGLIQGANVAETRTCYAASNCNHANVVSAYIQKYGSRTQKQILAGPEKAQLDHAKAMTKMMKARKPGTSSGTMQLAADMGPWCKAEASIKKDFLGFTIWTDATGAATFFWNSKQLNGPNLDEPQLPNLNTVINAGNGEYTGSDNKQHKIGFIPEGPITLKIRTLFPNKPVLVRQAPAQAPAQPQPQPQPQAPAAAVKQAAHVKQQPLQPVFAQFWAKKRQQQRPIQPGTSMMN
jgi:hypothetical protein